MITEYRLRAFHSARHVVFVFFVLAPIQSIDTDDEDDDDDDADETKTIASERENKRNRCTNRNAYHKTTPSFSSSLLLSTFHHSISVNNDIINTADADPFFFTYRTKTRKSVEHRAHSCSLSIPMDFIRKCGRLDSRSNLPLFLIIVDVLNNLQSKLLQLTVVQLPKRKQFTLKDVSAHCTETDCWMVIRDLVYDLTDFLHEVSIDMPAKNVRCLRAPQLV
jgi:hypothetical protein